MSTNNPRPRLLFLSAHLPSPRATQAGQLSAFRNLDVLAKHYDIHIITFRTPVERSWSVAPLEERCGKVEIFDVDNSTRISGVLQAPHLPIMIAARNQRGFHAAVQRAIAIQSFARVHLEWTQMARYLSDLRSISSRTLSIYDVLAQAAERKIKYAPFLARPALRLELLRTYRWERNNLKGLDRIFVPSIKDKELYSSMVPGIADDIMLIPLAFNLLTARILVPQGPFKIAYWGSYARQENVDAALFLIDQVLPELEKLGLETKVLLIGANPPPSLECRRSEKITVTGFVDDPTVALTSAHLAVLPLRLGAGVKVKVLECLGAGVPVVTTPIGGEGILCNSDNGLFVVEATAHAISAKVVELANTKGSIQSLSVKAAAWARLYAAADTDSLLFLDAKNKIKAPEARNLDKPLLEN
jgi:glycosyltransferase involved in cell wall biosynthesis